MYRWNIYKSDDERKKKKIDLEISKTELDRLQHIMWCYIILCGLYILLYYTLHIHILHIPYVRNIGI